MCDFFESDHGNMCCESVQARSFLRGNKNEIFVVSYLGTIGTISTFTRLRDLDTMY